MTLNKILIDKYNFKEILLNFFNKLFLLSDILIYLVKINDVYVMFEKVVKKPLNNFKIYTFIY